MYQVEKALRQIDWEAVSAVVMAIATAALAWAAFRGVNAWKKQMRGQSTYDLAGRVLKTVFKLRREIQYTRSRGGSGTPPERYDEPGGQIEHQRQEYAGRLRLLFGVVEELEVLQHEVMALLGREKAAVLKELDVKTRSLWSTYSVRFDAERQRVERGDQLGPDDVEMRETLYGSSDENDRFFQDVETGIRKVEDTFRPYLSI